MDGELMTRSKTKPENVLDFWFSAEPKLWFAKNDAFDAAIRSQFGMALADARSGKLAHWESDLRGLQALVILLDQFSRNLFRGLAGAFACDDKALALSHKLVGHPGFDQLGAVEKQFAVMPMMHSENLQEQHNCLDWMRKIGLGEAEKFAQIHLDIIEKFGRFPHRNNALGRETTCDEQAFLAAGGFAG